MISRKTMVAAILVSALVGVSLAESETPAWNQTVSLGDALARLFQVHKGMPRNKVFETLDLQRTKGMMATPSRRFPGVKMFYRTDSSNLLFCLTFRQAQGTHDYNPLLERVEIYSFKPKTDTSPMVMHQEPITLEFVKKRDSEQDESTVPVKAAPSAPSTVR